jgi:uncharacterized delta-60 repeat protein
VALFASALLAPSVGAKVRYPRLDPGFGSGGYVALPGALPAPGSEPISIEGLAATRSGASYATESSLAGGRCSGQCLYNVFLARVNANGAIASTFGGSGRVEIGSGVERAAAPIADLQGRAVVATLSGTSVTVRRHLANGSIDSSFGSGGTTTVDFGGGAFSGRQLELALDGEGRTIVSLSIPAFYNAPPIESSLARLLPDGALDPSFGSGGILPLGAQPTQNGITFGTKNAIYMWGDGAAGYYLHRISAKGRTDVNFDAQADATLANLKARGGLELGEMVLVPRPGGLLDVYGGERLLRLRSNGTPETKFGAGGVKTLGWSIIAATLVGHGKVLALGESEGVSLVRIKSNGKPDNSFGSEGATQIEGVEREGGLSLAWLSGRRAMVLDLGKSFCRYGGCPQRPALVRYQIGPKQS